MSACEDCGKELSGRSELDAGACVPCMAASFKSRRGIDSLLREREAEVRSLSERSERAERALERRKLLHDVERRGRAAAETGAPESENPYDREDPAQLEEHTMWLSGWTHEDCLQELERSWGFISWVSESLVGIQEIMNETGVPEEIVLKVGTIVTKAAERTGG